MKIRWTLGVASLVLTLVLSCGGSKVGVGTDAVDTPGSDTVKHLDTDYQLDLARVPGDNTPEQVETLDDCVPDCDGKECGDDGCPCPESLFWDFDEPCGAEGWSTDSGWGPSKCENHTPGGECALFAGSPDSCDLGANGTSVSPVLALSNVQSLDVEFSVFWGEDIDLCPFVLDHVGLTLDQVLSSEEESEPVGNPMQIWSKPCSKMCPECDQVPPTPPCDQVGCVDFTLGGWQTFQFTVDLDAYDWIPGFERMAILGLQADTGDLLGDFVFLIDNITITPLCQ